ncbi:MAG: hypothetical protein HQL69_24010 [Magnetococcales bacterium]|nr:hypothetical protein [Magnetococcales bacterium]
MGKSFRKLITMFVVPLLIFMNAPVIQAVAATSETKIVHNGVAEAASGKRLQIIAKVTDSEGVDIVRTYFKAAEGKNFNFVAMEDIGDNQYSGTLPAPAANADSINYLILVKNSANVVVKSQTYQTTVVKGNGGTPTGDPVQVYSELAEAPTEIAGFSDSITTDVVVSAAKFGVVAGVVSQVAAGGSVAGAGAVSAGTTTATTTAATTATTAAATTTAAASGGMSTIAVVGLGALAVGGGALALSGGGDDDSSSSSSTSDSSLSGSSGVVRFNLAFWNNSSVDLDLHVSDPCSNEISFLNTSATCQGYTGSLDVDDVGSSGTGENIVWVSAAPTGTYNVWVQYYGGTSTVSYTLTTVINGSTTTRTGSLSSGSSSVYSFSY